ncbi:unnamed protein product, partial [Ectocarpus sp. 12 AP-2014]
MVASPTPISSALNSKTFSSGGDAPPSVLEFRHTNTPLKDRFLPSYRNNSPGPASYSRFGRGTILTHSEIVLDPPARAGRDDSDTSCWPQSRSRHPATSMM